MRNRIIAGLNALSMWRPFRPLRHWEPFAFLDGLVWRLRSRPPWVVDPWPAVELADVLEANPVLSALIDRKFEEQVQSGDVVYVVNAWV